MKPNHLIVGSIKCGTTALYNFLARQPKIAGSTPETLAISV